MKNLLIILFAVSLLLAACQSEKNESTATVVDSVEVLLLKKETLSKTLTLPAELHAWERAEVFAKMEGYVRALKVDIGDKVKKDEVLIVLDAPEITANYAKAAADMQAAQANYRTSLDVYARTLKAAQERGAVSASEIERIKNQMHSDSASYEAARSSANAYAQLKNYLTIRAAFQGVITQRHADLGTLVGKEEMPLLVLENISKLRLRVNVPETYTSALPNSSAIQFTVDAQPAAKYNAILTRKSNQIDLKTRTEMWEFEVSNPDYTLKPGMYARININLTRQDAAFAIPHTALVTNQEKRFVIRVREGKTEWVEVRTGIQTDRQVEIFGDLQEEDLIIARANDEIKPGTTIQAVRRK